MKEVLRRIEQPDGFDLMNEGQVTTRTGVPAQISVNEVRSIVHGINPAALTKPGIITTNKDGADYLDVRPVPLGPVFEVLSTVMPDNASISLRVIATLTEFIGYDKPASQTTVYVNGKKQTTVLPLPIFRVLQGSNNCVLLDGETLVLGKFVEEVVTAKPDGTHELKSRENVYTIEQTTVVKDKVPLLGDLPLIGGLFRSETTRTTKKQILVFVTATIINPAGYTVKPPQKR